MKAQKLIIYAPVSGQTVALEQVPDPIFSQKMMGEGIAIVPENGEIVSPVDGEI
ncbi:PTS glucose transporter subunit IIA, partial [uncultured Dubosiella sp.]